jgi:ABC-2 type transport system ATP-binding protein
VLILDEPTVGLDPKQIIEIRNLVQNLGRSHTVILSSHILPEVQAVCERVVVINNGRLVADGTPDNLSQEMTGNHKLIVRMAGREQEIRSGLLGLSRVKEVASLGSKEPGACDFSVEAEPGVDLRRDLFALASRSGWPILGLKNNDLTLEDVFLRLTGGGYEMPAGKKEAAKK